MTYRRLLELECKSRARDVFEVSPSEFDFILGLAIAYAVGTMQSTRCELSIGPVYEELNTPQPHSIPDGQDIPQKYNRGESNYDDDPYASSGAPRVVPDDES